ncbi:MAG: thermonuclease family protein [Chloroflexi bacterium]|nr:thermonuclease family protein [Chloroflexota bacterium]
MVYRNDGPTEPEESQEDLGEESPEYLELAFDDGQPFDEFDDGQWENFEYPGPSPDDIARSQSDEYQSRFTGQWLKSAGAVLLIFAALGLLISLVGPLAFSRGGPATQNLFESGRVQQVVDGNTIVVDINGHSETVRYIGIAVGVPGESLYRSSRLVNQSWVEGEAVILERDNQDKDADGRLLRYVYVNNTMVNAVLVNNGLARYLPDRSNIRYNQALLSAENAARGDRRGMWADGVSVEVSPA